MSLVIDQSGGAQPILTISGDRHAVGTGANLIAIPGPLQPILTITPADDASKSFSLIGLDVLTLPDISEFVLLKNATLTGASFQAVNGSQMTYDKAATAVTGGVQVDVGFALNQTRVNIYLIPFGVGDSFTLCIAGQEGEATKASGSLRWIEQ